MSYFLWRCAPIVVKAVAIVLWSRDDFARFQIVEAVDVDGVESRPVRRHFKFALRKAADSAFFTEEHVLVPFLSPGRIIPKGFLAGKELEVLLTRKDEPNSGFVAKRTVTLAYPLRKVEINSNADLSAMTAAVISFQFFFLLHLSCPPLSRPIFLKLP